MLRETENVVRDTAPDRPCLIAPQPVGHWAERFEEFATMATAVEEKAA
ncbi:MAG: hypothetical protein AAF713_08330 [Pseudomonadota bacterium]